MTEKRIRYIETAQMALDLEGVGARQEGNPTPSLGGGYQENCTVFKFSKKPGEKIARDPRLDELAQMGLSRVWLAVAEEIGFDPFMAMWRILDAEPTSHHKEGFLQLSLKQYRSYLRYQRNRLIEALASQGMSAAEIHRRLDQQLCETVSIRHIQRLTSEAYRRCS